MKVTSKILLLSLFAIPFAQAMEELSSGKLTQIKKSSLFATHDVGEIDLFHNDKGFHVVHNDEVHSIDKLSVDPVLRTLKHKQLKKFQKIGYIQVKKNNHNEFSLVSKVRGNGGGAGGATAGFWAGKWVTHAVAQTVYALAATGTTIVTGGNLAAGAVVWASLQSTFALPVEAASNVIGCAAGIAGGAATGLI